MMTTECSRRCDYLTSFATVEIERMSQDPDWLDKAIRIVEKQIQEMNRRQRGKDQLEIL
jgi:hypothetical protein